MWNFGSIGRRYLDEDFAVAVTGEVFVTSFETGLVLLFQEAFRKFYHPFWR